MHATLTISQMKSFDHQPQKREGYRQTHEGKFEEAYLTFRKLLHCMILAVAGDAEQEKDIRNLIFIATQYTLTLGMQLQKSKPDNTQQRQLELMVTMMSTSLEPQHTFLFQRQAMVQAYKSENFIDAAAVAKTILRGQSSQITGSVVQKTLQQAKGVLQGSEAKGEED
jgi:hypothetical protein